MNSSIRSPAWRINKIHEKLTRGTALFFEPTITNANFDLIEVQTNNQKRNKQNKMNYLKTIKKQVRQRGTTLIELSVVIAVLLLLVGVLFVGITAWKSGANTAACV